MGDQPAGYPFAPAPPPPPPRAMRRRERGTGSGDVADAEKWKGNPRERTSTRLRGVRGGVIIALGKESNQPSEGGVKMMNEKILELVARLPRQFYLRKKRSAGRRGPQTRRDFLWYCATMAGIVKTLSLMPPAQAIGYGLGASSGIAFFLSGVQSMGGESGQRRGDSMAITLSPERTTATDLRHLFSSYVLF